MKAITLLWLLCILAIVLLLVTYKIKKKYKCEKEKYKCEKQDQIPEFWIDWLERFYEQVKDKIVLPKEKADKICVIVEPRKSLHKLLKYVIYNFMYLLGPHGWGLHVFCGKGNKIDVEEMLGFKNNRNVKITELSSDNLPIYEYNRLLTNSSFYESIINNPSHILIFQTDTLLVDGDLSEFMDYDFVGAPWSFYTDKGGNGGLSLRKNRKMIEFCKTHKYDGRNEDVYFSTSRDIYTPPLEIAKKFSSESTWEPNSKGLHATYKFINICDIDNYLKNNWNKIFHS
jgi:hypothetical protein